LSGVKPFVGDNIGYAMLKTYQMALGDWDLEPIGQLKSDSIVMMFYIFFFLSTIFLQITLLNLLIAIMGDTYDRVLEVAKES
jgi:hypothetical protein